MPCSNRSAHSFWLLIIGVLIITFSTPPTWAETKWESDRVFVETQGKGAPVIIIPGLSSSPEVFKPTFAKLDTNKHALHYVTLGGFGGTPAPNDLSAFTRPAANELIRYIQDNELRDVSLIGHSMGGLISLLIAAEIPERVNSILIIDSVPFLAALFQPGADPAQIAARKNFTREQILAQNNEQFAAYAKTQILPIQATSPESQAIIWRDLKRADRTAYAVAASEIFTTDYSDVLPRVKAATTVLIPHNEFLPGSPEQIRVRYETLYNGLEKSTYRIIPNSRHFIMLDQPETFAQEVQLFLGK